jgi:hypothetical protein
MIELFFRFTVKGTVLRNIVFFFSLTSMLWRSAVRSISLQQSPPNQKNRFYTESPPFAKSSLLKGQSHEIFDPQFFR